MRLALIVTIQSASDVALARRLVAGRPWIVRLVDRVGRAASVSRVVIACHQGSHEIATLFDSAVSVVVADDPMVTAQELDGDHDGVAFCPVTQLFADPRRLDAVAGLDMQSDTATAVAVLSCDPAIVLTGGAFLEVVTRFGLRALCAGERRSSLRTALWHTSPAPPEMRLETCGDMDWAIGVDETLLARDPSGALDHFDEALSDAGLRRFAFWDEMGPPPRSVLTIRCLRQPLFECFVRYLGRLPGATIDVVCRTDLAEETRALRGVGQVFTYDAPTFSVDALGPHTLESIRARGYDLCVIPLREATGRGFENVVPMARASGATTAIWLDIAGHAGLLAGRAQAWDAACTGGPHERADAYLRRAVRALDDYATVPKSQADESMVTG